MTQLALPAVLYVNSNPLLPPGSEGATIVPPGTRVGDLHPKNVPAAVVRVNGQFLLQKDWWRPVLPGDVIEWFVVYQGGGGGAGSRTILSLIAAVVISSIPGLQGVGGALIKAGLTIASQVLINALVPLNRAPSADASQGNASSTYNVALSGNQARLNQPIPVIYGRHLLFPDFAAQPYVEYINNDQFYYAVFSIGQGQYVFERKLIDDTDLDHFSDITIEELEPGELPTIALANVVTAVEVSGQELNTNIYVGGFAATNAELEAAEIGIDIVLPRGLGVSDSSGSISNYTVEWDIEYREIDDFGVATTLWVVLASESHTANTTTPQRLSYRYTLPAPARVEIRLVRTDIKNESNFVLNELTWAGMRAYLTVAAPLSSTVTHLAVRIRASDQLSSLSQRKIAVVVRRLLRTWSLTGGSPSGAGWTAPVETRNPAWALADLWSNAVYGDGLSDERIDTTTLLELATEWDERQDRFDYVFDSRVTSWEAAKLIAQAGRAVPVRRNGVNTVMRDGLQDLPITAFTSRDMAPGSFSMNYLLVNENTSDAVYLEYFSNRTWDWKEIKVNAPTVVTPSNPVRVRVSGITGSFHARREATYMAAVNFYRRRYVKWTTEMQGVLPAYGSLVVLSPSLNGWGESGDVVDWDAGTGLMTLTEPVTFVEAASHFISLTRDDGTVTDAIPVTPGPTANQVILASAPDFELFLDLAISERPRFVFGTTATSRVYARVLSISRGSKSDDGAQLYDMTAVVEDVRVHEADNALLPSPGDIQDPVTSENPGTGEGSGGSALIVNIVNTLVEAGSREYPPQDVSFSITLANDGSLTLTSYSLVSGSWSSTIANQWLLYHPVETADAGLFEVLATDVSTEVGIPPGYAFAELNTVATGTLDTYLPLDTSRTWTIFHSQAFVTIRYLSLRLQIRNIATGLIQDSAVYTFASTIDYPS